MSDKQAAALERAAIRNAVAAFVGWLALVPGSQWLLFRTLPDERGWITAIIIGAIVAALAYNLTGGRFGHGPRPR